MPDQDAIPALTAAFLTVCAAFGAVGIVAIRAEFGAFRRPTKGTHRKARHRAGGQSTSQQTAARIRADRQAVAKASADYWRWVDTVADQHHEPDELDAPPPVDHRWDRLRPRVLATEARMVRRAHRLRSAYGTPEEVDSWEPEPAMVGAR